MKNKDQHAAQEELARKSALELSELVLINPALGAGVSRPEGFLTTPYWTSTCGVHPAIHQARIRAEHLLSADERQWQKDERRQLKALEKKLKESEGKAKESVVSDTIRCTIPGFGGPVTDYDAIEETTDDLKEQIAALKAKISSHCDVVWAESGTCKSTLVEVLSNSRFHATSFVDSLGSQLGLYFALPAKFAADLSWLTLGADRIEDISFVRSSATGGATITKLAKLDHNVRFNWFVSANRASIRTLGEMITNRPSARKALGSTLLLDEEHDSRALYEELVHDTTWKKLIDTFYLAAENPYRVTFPSEDVAAGWRAFTEANVYDLIDPEDLERCYDKEDTQLVCKPDALTTAVMQAATNRLILRYLNTGTLPESRDLVLTAADLEWAWQTARNVFPIILGFDKNFARARQARKLAYSRFMITPERLDSAYNSIMAALQGGGGILAHSAAVRLPNVSAKLLETMVQRGKIRQLLRERPEDAAAMAEGRCAGRMPERAYMAASTLEMHPEEAKAEFEAAMHKPDKLDEIGTIMCFSELREKAENAKYRGTRCTPALPISELTSEQIAAIPAILAMYPDEVQVRNTADNPESPHMIDDKDHVTYLPADVPAVWFRWSHKGQPLMPWQHMPFIRWSGKADATRLSQTVSEENKPHRGLLAIA